MAGYIGSKASVVSSGAERKKVFAITTSTTSLTGLAYTVNQVHVFHNGIRLVDGTDYTATDGTTITLTNAAANGDEVVVVSYAAFQTSDTVSASAGGTFSNAVTVDADGATVLTVDRATSDGAVIDVQKDGSTVGSIRSENGYTKVVSGNGTAGSGLGFYNYKVSPVNPNGNVSDSAIDLGDAGSRFNNLYLSGGVLFDGVTKLQGNSYFIGGSAANGIRFNSSDDSQNNLIINNDGSSWFRNGIYLGATSNPSSANHLDDYEEGTFTPTYVADSTNPTVTYVPARKGLYVKVGSIVHASIYIEISALSANGSGGLAVGGLPFQSSGDIYHSGAVGYAAGFDNDKTPTSILVKPANTQIALYYQSTADPRSATTRVQASDLDNFSQIYLQVSYRIA